MSTENNTNAHWPDPKDYGLPMVEIKPIYKNPSSSAAVAETPIEVKKPVVVDEVVPNQVVQSIIAERISEQKEPKKEEVRPTKPPVAKVNPPKQESKSWIGIAAVFAIILLAVIIWQMTAGNQSTEESLSAAEEPVEISRIPEKPEAIVNDSKEEEIQATENQTPEIESSSSTPTVIQKPETGTTIDRTVQGTLIRVESKAERPTYFIIVGSLPNERLALEDAPLYQSRVPSVYLISPYDDTKNYRLAIGSFGSFTKANEELERIKADYTEALWILKY